MTESEVYATNVLTIVRKWQ